MANKKSSPIKKPTPQNTTDSVTAHAPSTEPDMKPSFTAYIRAIVQLVFGWIKSHKLRSLLGVLVILVIIVSLSLILKPSQEPLTHDEIVVRVNKELSISGDGNPAILTVEDKTKATQPFLQQAENGDKVLLYYKAQKSVLYRPSEARIVHQGAYVPPDAKVFVRNGTNNDRRVSDISSRLESVQDIDLVSQDNSTKSDYKGITLVSITDRYDQKIRELEKLFDTQVVRLPAGESFPDADILIIVGN